MPAFLPKPRSWEPSFGICEHLNELSLNDFWLVAHLSSSLHCEGYEISITPDGLTLLLGSEKALCFAWEHFKQWRQTNPTAIPCGKLEDSPTFELRGFMLDISRCKVPTRESLAEWVGLLSDFRYNQLQLYTEHTFAYTKHQAVWQNSSPLNADDIAWLQSTCQKQGIELVPNQNCFGHFERWICHHAYRKFAESPDGFMTPWGDKRSVGSVLKPDQESFDLVTGLLDELLPHFESSFVNIGCDETFELGQGASKQRCEKEGSGKVYSEFVCKIMSHISAVHGKRSQFWGDIILKTPEALPFFPQNALALEWGYEANHPFEQDSKCFADSGLDFVLCPGTSSWRSFAGRTNNMLQNIQEAAQAALTQGALGLLLTDWGDNGHLQQNPVSYPALAWCGLNAWNPNNASSEDANRWCDDVAFKGTSGDTDCWLAAGSVSDLLGKTTVNCNALFQLFQKPKETEVLLARNKLETCLAAIEGLSAPKTFKAEWEQTIRNLKLPLLKALDSSGLEKHLSETLEGHKKLWRQRNREGGLAESVAMYNQMTIKLTSGENDE